MEDAHQDSDKGQRLELLQRELNEMEVVGLNESDGCHYLMKTLGLVYYPLNKGKTTEDFVD